MKTNGYVPLTPSGFIMKWLGTMTTARNHAGSDIVPMRTLEFWTRMISETVERPVFVIGCPRSGTTMMGRIIDSIPNVNEFHEPNIDRWFPKMVFENRIPRWASDLYYRATFNSLLKIAPKKGKRFAEKNPHNTFAVDALRHAFEDARFIYMYRDGRDVVASFLRHPWHLNKSDYIGSVQHNRYKCGPYPHYYIEKSKQIEYLQASNARRCAWVWRRYMEEGARLMGEYKDDIIFVKYEDLILNPKTEIVKLLSFINENNNENVNAVMDEARLGHQRAIGKWKTLHDSAIRDIYLEAGEQLHMYGYTD